MNYRKLGSTSFEISELGMGSEGFVGKTEAQVCDLVDCALGGGVNYFDLYNSDPSLHRYLGRALGARRKNVYIQAHFCTAWQNDQYLRTRDFELTKKSFADMMSSLGTDYIDVGMIHCVDGMKDYDTVFDGPIIEYVHQLKDKGVIKYIGLSSHNPDTALKAVKRGDIDVLMFSINPCYDMVPPSENLELLWADESYEKPLHNFDPARESLYEYCASAGVGITVMKAFGGGDLLNEKLSPFGVAMSPFQCMSYALTRPAVSSVLGGFNTPGEITAALGYFSADDGARDYSTVLSSVPKHTFSGRCMYCGHCAPCPVKIDVASLNKYLNLALSHDFVPETVAMHYGTLERHAEDCIGCGSCERNCPFGVPVRERIALAKKTFGY